MRIAVIDDERPSRSELMHLISENCPQAQLSEADNAQKALELASCEEFDVFFVDINLGDMSGTTLSLMLKKLQPKAQVVFATAYNEYALTAFDVDAADYILKPFDPARVTRALQRVECRLGAAGQKEEPTPKPDDPGAWGCITILSDKRTIVLELSSIRYLETDSRSCVLHTSSGDYTSAQSLGYFEKKLAPHHFLRIHKSYLVNLQQVTEISPWMGGLYSLRLHGSNLQLPVSRKQVRPLREIFGV